MQTGAPGWEYVVGATSVNLVDSFGSHCACSFSIKDSKKRLAEKTSANEVLQKSLGKTKAENAELLKKVQELELRMAELEPALETEVETEAEAA